MKWTLLTLLFLIGCNSVKPDLSSISGIVDPDAPQVIHVGSVTPGIYLLNEQLDFTVTFSEPVNVSGSPQLQLSFDSGNEIASYLGGSGTNTLLFRKNIDAGEFEVTGVGITGRIFSNGGKITSVLENKTAALNFETSSISGVRVNAINTVFQTITGPADGLYKAGSSLCFVASYSAPVTITSPLIKLPFTLNGITYNANYVSGNNNSNLRFCYTVAANVLGAGITINPSLIDGTLNDVFGSAVSTSVSGTFPSVVVDGEVPAILSVTMPTLRTYYPTETIEFVVNFTENVSLSGGNPNITFTSGGQTKSLEYAGMPNSTSMRFRYTVVAGDPNFASVNPASTITLNGATISDTAGNPLPVTEVIPYTSLTGLRIDGTGPTISSVNLQMLYAPAPYTFTKGQTIRISVTFNGTVYRAGTGTPYINLNIGGSIKQATLVTNVISSILDFEYILEEGISDTDGIEILGNINPGTEVLRDGVSTLSNLANLNFTGRTISDAFANGFPHITNMTVIGGSRTFEIGSAITIQVTFSEAVTVTGTPQIRGNANNPPSSTVTPLSFNGNQPTSTQIDFTHTVSTVDLNGISLTRSINLNGGTIQSATGLSAQLDFPVSFGHDIFFIPTYMAYWFDMNDPLALNINGFDLLELNSKARTFASTLTGTPAVYTASDPASAEFDASVVFEYPLARIATVVIVVTAPTDVMSAGKRAFNLKYNGITDSYVEFRNDGTLKTNSINSSTYNGSNFITNTSGIIQSKTWSPGQKMIITTKFPIDNYVLTIGSNFFTGKIHEIVIFDDHRTPAELAPLHDYLLNKHGIIGF